MIPSLLQQVRGSCLLKQSSAGSSLRYKRRPPVLENFGGRACEHLGRAAWGPWPNSQL